MNISPKVTQSMPPRPVEPVKVSATVSAPLTPTDPKPIKEAVTVSATDPNELSDDIKAILSHPKANQKLKPQELEFVKYYQISKNPRLAAIKACYSDSVSKSSAFKWVSPVASKNSKPWIFATLHTQSPKIEAIAAKKAINLAADCAALDIVADKIDAHYVLNKTAEHVQKNNGEIPTHFKRSVDQDTGEEIFTPVYAYNATAVGKGLELLGKHKDVKAFNAELEINTDSTLGGLLSSIASTVKPPVLQRINPLDIEEGVLTGDTSSDEEPVKPSVLPNQGP